MRQFSQAPVGVVLVMAGWVCAAPAAEPVADSGAKGDGPSLRPIHWWIGNLEHRAQAATSNLVASWSYWPLNGVFDVTKEERRMRLLVGGPTSIGLAIQQVQERYERGFRMLATNHENWQTPTSVAQAQQFVDSIDSRPGLTVLQWNHWMTWVAGARPVLENAAQLELVEMAYPTAEGRRTYSEIYDWIMWFMQQYSPGKEPGIGLSVYTAHDSATPISWALMKTQIDAAKAVGEALGSPRHPIGIYISNAQPTEFTVDDVNYYIIYGTRIPPAFLDTFESGDVTLAANAYHGTLVHQLTPLTTGCFTDGRRVTDLHLGSGAGIQALLSPDSPDQSDDALTFTMQPHSKGTATVWYDGNALANLAADGRNAFEVTVTAAPLSGTLCVHVEDAYTSDYAHVSISGPGIYTFAFNDVNRRSQTINFTQVRTVSFGIQARSTDTSLTYQISDIRVVGFGAD